MTYSKYNITIRMLAIGVAALLLVPLIAQTPAQIATAVPNENANNAASMPPEDFELVDVLPDVTPADEARARQIFLANSEVQRMIGTDSYKFMATGSFTYNAYEEPAKWYLQVNINVADQKQVFALVDLKNGTVTNVQEAPIVKLGHNRSVATDYYSGSNQMSGIRMKSVLQTTLHQVQATTFSKRSLLTAR